MKKSGELVPKIIEAKTKEEAIQVLSDTLDALYLSTSYTEMVYLRDKLETYQKKVKEVSIPLKENIIEYDVLNGTRLSLSFLYRDIQDDLSADINANKIFYEEIKTSRRAESMQELMGSEEAEKFNAKSTNQIKEIVGASKSYKQYASEYAIAYGNYKTLETLLGSIKLLLDAVASRERKELFILQKDAK
ncbi:MAG: hypothetical protein WD512_04945 [Candidatus Paceibacterota bacterium]